MFPELHVQPTDPDYVRTLYAHHAREVAMYVAWWNPLLPRWLSIEDLLQEVWLAAAAHPARCERSLHQFVKHAVIDVLRKYGIPQRSSIDTATKAYNMRWPSSLEEQGDSDMTEAGSDEEAQREARNLILVLWPHLTPSEQQIVQLLAQEQDMAVTGKSYWWNSICKSRIRDKLIMIQDASV